MSRGTLDPALLLSVSPTGLSPSLAGLSRTVPLQSEVINAVRTPECTHSGLGSFNFAYGIFTLSDQISQNCSAIDSSTLCSPQPRGARTTVWALSISLAATLEIEVSFFSSGYLDVSVPPVPFHTLWIGVWILEVCSSGFPHSDISGSMDICSSPKLFAAYHVLHRLSVPRHPPCALNA